jgi:hypothetical protein
MCLLAVVSQAGTISVNAENDIFAPNNTDKYYTHGSRISYLTESENKYLKFDDQFLFGDKDKWEYSIGQYMYTPDDISVPTLQEGERPYAGVVYGEAAHIKYDEKQYSRLGYVAGIIGPSAYCEQTQKIIHEWTGSESPEGWDNQINNEPIANIQYTYQYKVMNGEWYDLTPRMVGAIGNADIYAGSGADLRIGYNMETWGYSAMEPLPREVKRPSCYILVGAEGRCVGRNITLDGNTFQDSYSVDKEPFVGEWYFGGGVKLNGVSVEYKINYRTHEFETQNQNAEFGSIALRFDV